METIRYYIKFQREMCANMEVTLFDVLRKNEAGHPSAHTSTTVAGTVLIWQ